MALINTIEEIKTYVAVDNATRIESILPYIEEAEIIFLKDLIGEEFYEELKTKFSEDPINENFIKIKPFIQRPLINYAFFLSTAMYGASVSDMGIQVNQTSESTPAPQWKVQKIEGSWLNTAYTFADVLLAYLEKNATIFLTWANSSKGLTSKIYYINSTAEFQSVRGINNSRRTFLALKPFIEEAEPMIEKLIGTALHEEMKGQIKNNSLTDKNKELLKKIRPVVALYALLEAIPLLSVSIAADSIMINSYNNGIEKKDAPTDKQLQALLTSLRNKLMGSMEQLKAFLTLKVDDYPLYKEHINYTSQRIGLGTKRYINKPGSKNFLIG